MKASFKYQIYIFTINQSNIYFEISMCESFRILRESFFSLILSPTASLELNVLREILETALAKIEINIATVWSKILTTLSVAKIWWKWGS